MMIKPNRFSSNPLIVVGQHADLGNNINGPSVIRVPEWIDSPLGRYYMYFAHHDGDYIRLAYSDSPEGPWLIHKGGVLPLASSLFKGHIASPDVHVVEESQEIRLYFHGSDAPTGDFDAPQYSRLAVSNDGLEFLARKELLGNPYMRVFNHAGDWYALAMPGIFYRSADGLSNFEAGPTLFTEHMRHSAVYVDSNCLQVIYTNVGDAPESLLVSQIDLTPDWLHWQSTEPVQLLKPEFAYEGANLESVPSVRGMSVIARNELRDPALFRDEDNLYLYYAIASEQGIAGAWLEYILIA